MKKNHIISPYLSIQKFHFNMFFSILNRICAFVLIFYMFYMFYIIGAVLNDFELYYKMVDFYQSIFGKIVNILGYFCFLYHFFSSVKYLSFSKGNIKTLTDMNVFSISNFIISLIIALLLGV